MQNLLILSNNSNSFSTSEAFTQGRCWPNGCPKQNCIVVLPPSNIIDVKKNKKNYYRGQNRTLIKYKSK